MRKLTLGLLLALTLALVSPAVADGPPAVDLPSFNVVQWVLNWLGFASSEPTPTHAMDSAFLADESDGSEADPPGDELGPAMDPGGFKSPELNELGPAADPGG